MKEAEEKRLYQELAARYEDDDGNYAARVLELLISPEECMVALQLPGTVESVSKKMGMDVAQIEERVSSMVQKGVIFINDANGRITIPAAFMQMADFALATPHYDGQRDSSLNRLVRNYINSDVFINRYRGNSPADATWRILPRFEAVRFVPGLMPCESVEEILRQYDGEIAFVRCICREINREAAVCGVNRKNSTGGGYCIKFGEVARYYVEKMHIGTYVSAEEARAIINGTDGFPVYHMIGNSREVMGGFCNCCNDCCVIRAAADNAGNPKFAIRPSRFMVRYDDNSCIRCGSCAEVCPFDALSLNNGSIKMDEEKCMGCGTCVVNCPEQALKMELVRTVDHIPKSGNQHIYDSLGY